MRDIEYYVKFAEMMESKGFRVECGATVIAYIGKKIALIHYQHNDNLFICRAKWGNNGKANLVNYDHGDLLFTF